jgi:NAD(P)-dependent dehydrogenase (short-subunit alcohol dehydrogenase family)
MGRLEGRVAVVTGAGRGIGREIAIAYAQEGAAVALAARSPDQIEAVATEIRKAGGIAAAIVTDVTDGDDVRRLAGQAAHELGDIGVLVNCAGAHVAGAFQALTVEDFQRLFDINLLSCVRTTLAFLPAMEAAGWGRIINIASSAGKYGSVNQSPYNTSKHAVIGLTRCLAMELARTGITANALCPGLVETKLADDLVAGLAQAYGGDPDEALARFLQRVPMGRLLTTAEIAPLAVYLASDESSGMTGQSLSIDGGLVLC